MQERGTISSTASLNALYYAEKSLKYPLLYRIGQLLMYIEVKIYLLLSINAGEQLDQFIDEQSQELFDKMEQ